MEKIVTPQPHLWSGYTGHVPQIRERVGKTFGRQTHKIFIDPCIYRAPKLIVEPDHGKCVSKENPTQRELNVLKDREKMVDVIYKHPIIPGYAGFVPNIYEQTGKRFVAAAAASVAQHETLMELYRCDKRTLLHRDLLESGKGLFEHKVHERLLPQTYYRAPLIPVTSPSKAFGTDKCPPKVKKQPYSKSTIPHFMEDDDEEKYIINHYAAHIPMSSALFGAANKVITHRALCNFSNLINARVRDKWCPGQDLSPPDIICPPVGHFKIYHEHSGMIPNYAGHVPGELYKFGRTFDKTTFNAKHWLDIHKNLEVLPEVAHVNYEY